MGYESSDPTQVVDGLVGAIKSIAADHNYNLLADVFNEVLQLRKKTADLINTNRNIFEQYWQFRNEYEEARTKLDNARAALQEELSGKVKNLADLTDAHTSLIAEHAETKVTLAETASAKAELETNLETANTEISELRSTISGLEHELSQVTCCLEEQKRMSDKAAQKNASLQVSLSQRETELEKVKADLQTTEQHLQEAVNRGDGLKGTLDQVQAELTAKTSRLNELDSYRVVLKEEPEDVFVKILDNVWTKLYDLVESHFQQDLEEKVLRDASCWNNLRNADALMGPTQMPLPQTNTPIAKAMRIAAVLSILSRTLYKYIFRPFYLLRDDEEFTALLHDVEDDSPVKEENIRATLLATMPKLQQASAKARAQHVVRDVSWVVQHLLGAIVYDSFCTNLGNACALACTEWQKIQNAKIKIEPYFGPPYDDFDWQALPLPEFGCHTGTPRHFSRDSSTTRCGSRPRRPDHGDAEAPSVKNDKEKADGDDAVVSGAADATDDAGDATGEGAGGGDGGDAKASGADADVQADGAGVGTGGGEGAGGGAGGDASDAKDANDESKATNPEPAAAISSEEDIDANDAIASEDEDEDTEVDPNDILLVVWPSMVVVENGEQSPITQGLVISKQQASLAYHEVRLARMGHRFNTKRARTMSFPSLPNTNIAASLKQDPSFLGEGGGEKECID